MGWFKRQKPFTVVLPSGKDVKILGSEDAITEFTEIMHTACAEIMHTAAMLAGGTTSALPVLPQAHTHEWLSGLISYRVFDSEPKRYQLMCGDCGSWVDVTEYTFQRYLAKEIHREQVEMDKAEREAEFRAPIIMYGDEE